MKRTRTLEMGDKLALKRFGSKVASFAVSLGVSLFTFILANAFYTSPTQGAEPIWRFDFGAVDAAEGYTSVDASVGYDSARGYGFGDPSRVKNVSAVGRGALCDAVQFVGADRNAAFYVDLPIGLYEIQVTLGNTGRASVVMEDMIQIVNMTGNNATDSVQIPITDGRLSILVVAGRAGTPFTLSALEIAKISDDPTLKPTIWICGDSTVCNYYPLASSVQAGWGQALGKYVDSSRYAIRNMAAGGEYARGFVEHGLFETIETYGKDGDYFVVSIGINDGKYYQGDVYKSVVTDMARRAQKKGMTVILVKQQGRANDISRDKLLTGRWFGAILDEIGASENVQVVDLFTLAQNYWLSIGQDAVYKLFMPGDALHPNRAGADKLAELVAREVEFGDVDREQASEVSGTP